MNKQNAIRRNYKSNKDTCTQINSHQFLLHYPTVIKIILFNIVRNLRVQMKVHVNPNEVSDTILHMQNEKCLYLTIYKTEIVTININGSLT